MRISMLFLMLLFLPVMLTGQIIPQDRTVNWTTAGTYALFDDPAAQLNVMDFGATGDGVTDDAAAIQSAIDAIGAQGGVVYLPGGEFLIQSPLTLPSRAVLRGVDSLSTHLLMDFEGEPLHGIHIAGAVLSSYYLLLSGYEKGSNSVVVANGEAFSDGTFAEIVQENGEWDTEPAPWAEQAAGQIVKVEAVNGDTLVLRHPLRMTYSDALEPKIRAIDPVKEVAVEQLRLERMDEPSEGAGSNIYINLATNIRIRDIESDKSVGSHLAIYRSTQVRLEGSYIHHAFTYDGSGTRGYGVTLHTHSGECLIENNVFEHLRHAMMVKTGANGNVFGYNYSIDPHRSETISDYSGDISLHGHYAYANLFEGNIAQNIFIDHYWCPSGPYNTFFRNRAELYGFVITASDNATDQQNVAGLEVTNTNFLYGMYTLNGSDHFEYGNYVTGDIVPVETDSLPDTSYYLSGLPAFWTQGLPWPSIGVPLEAGAYDIPAKQRHLGLNTMAGTRHRSALAIAPNPARSQIIFSGWGEGPVTISTFDLQGNKVLVQKESNKRSLAVSHLESGAYIITFQDEKRFAAKKVFIVR